MKKILSYIGAAGLIVSAGMTGCKTPDTSSRPFGNLGDTINSPKDDFAPMIPPGGNLHFTSSRETTVEKKLEMRDENIYVYSAGTSKPEIVSDSTSLLGYIPRIGVNEGTPTYLDSDRGFLALSHAAGSTGLLNQHGGIVGGIDIFEFHRENEQWNVRNLGREINSIFWDSHPAAAQKGDTVIMVFASDRPAGASGFGSPYEQQAAISGGDTVRGNADLYYTFRVNGRWSAPKNFAEAGGTRNVNTAFNEYSPYIYCITQRPTLLFASNRDGDMDIFTAGLDIDFKNQSIAILSVDRLEKGSDMINSTADDTFPFVPLPHETGVRSIYLASRRDQQPRMSEKDKKVVKSAGGMDLFKFNFAVECRPPQVTYNVTVLDRENPSRPVQMPFVELIKPDGNVELRQGRTATFTLDYGMKYSARGGSVYDKIECGPQDKVISHYSFINYVPAAPEIRKRIETITKDTVEKARLEIRTDSIYTREAFAISDGVNLGENANGKLTNVESRGDSLFVTRLKVTQTPVTIAGTPRTITRKETFYDTIPQFTTQYIRTTDQAAVSELSQRGKFPQTLPSHDIVINDTVFVLPRYYQFPPCRWEYVHLKDKRENVPYFQTGFWEVNTSENLRNHIPRFGNRSYDDASFIELHPENQYFGIRGEMTEEQKANRQVRRQNRIEEYRNYARNVDRNLKAMVSGVADTILPMYNELVTKMPESANKLLIQVMAYSDARPILRGWYAGTETVGYLAGSYDAKSGRMNLYNVTIPPGASLVGENNDTLSKLRAYYGYTEIMERLEQNPIFREYMSRGEVLLPTKDMTQQEFLKRAEQAKIIVLMEGRQIDGGARPSVPSYSRQEGDYYSLDTVRRVNVIVSRVNIRDGRIEQSTCCTPESTADALPFKKERAVDEKKPVARKEK
ncbi:MAG TPA: hypothetical protein VEC36_05055 [Patescibacteria group bacterium]|nr:hypothetical protein [Patescibacteria group bacterium]